MKIKIQTFSDDPNIVKGQTNELASFCRLMKLELEPVKDRHYHDVFYIPLKIANRTHVCMVMNCIEAYCIQHEYAYMFLDD